MKPLVMINRPRIEPITSCWCEVIMAPCISYQLSQLGNQLVKYHPGGTLKITP